MKFGHVTGHKRERKGSNAWYQTEEAEALIQQIEAEWAEKAKQQGK